MNFVLLNALTPIVTIPIPLLGSMFLSNPLLYLLQINPHVMTQYDYDWFVPYCYLEETIRFWNCKFYPSFSLWIYWNYVRSSPLGIIQVVYHPYWPSSKGLYFWYCHSGLQNPHYQSPHVQVQSKYFEKFTSSSQPSLLSFPNFHFLWSFQKVFDFLLRPTRPLITVLVIAMFCHL